MRLKIVAFGVAAAYASVGAANMHDAHGQSLTDNQVHAAYCLWFEQNHLNLIMRSLEKAVSGEREEVQPAIDADQARIKRFTRYLAATGALGSPSAQAAADQATDDNKRCLTFVARCHADHTNCSVTLTSPPCSTLRQCNLPDDLPM